MCFFFMNTPALRQSIKIQELTGMQKTQWRNLMHSGWNVGFVLLNSFLACVYPVFSVLCFASVYHHQCKVSALLYSFFFCFLSSTCLLIYFSPSIAHLLSFSPFGSWGKTDWLCWDFWSQRPAGTLELLTGTCLSASFLPARLNGWLTDCPTSLASPRYCRNIQEEGDGRRKRVVIWAYEIDERGLSCSDIHASVQKWPVKTCKHMNSDKTENKSQDLFVVAFCFLFGINCCAPCGGSLRGGVWQSSGIERTRLKSAKVVGLFNEGLFCNDLQ